MTKSSSYRADIQGLRAIAVLLVLLFHFETRLKGGYLGVDMFFVISGFVIASSTLREVASTNTFSWSAFLHRRVRRLLPGIAVVTVATSVLSMLFLSPFGPQRETAKMLLSAASYTSNFVLMPQSYFSLDPKANPLLHLWSLAVEEQFYFVWPIAIILFIGIRKRITARLFKSFVWVAVIGVVLASCWLFLVCSVSGSNVNEFGWFKPFIQLNITPEHFAFYSPFTRAWEFVAGVLAALFLRFKFVTFVHKAGSLITCCGVALVLFGVAWASKFPEIQHDASWSTNTSATLVVVAGTTLWIIGGIRGNFIRRFISLRPFTLIGDCSYSIYLLHWPIWVLMITYFNQIWKVVATALLLSFGFGWLQFHFIEEPIRSRKSLSSAKTSKFVGVFGIAASFGFVAMSYTTPLIAMHLTGKKPNELSVHINEKPCIGEQFVLQTAQSCLFPSPSDQGTVILVGDSMAKSLSDGFVQAANAEGLKSYVFSYPGCAFLLSDSRFSDTSACASWRTDALRAVEQIQPKALIIANLNSLYVETPFTGWTITNTEQAWGSEVARTLERLSELDIPVIFVQPPPRFGFDLRYDLSLLLHSSVKELRGVVVQRTEKMNGIEETALQGFDFVQPTVNLNELFCDSEFCDPKVKNIFMYEDDDHLSVDGSIYVSNILKRALAEALSK